MTGLLHRCARAWRGFWAGVARFSARLAGARPATVLASPLSLEAFSGQLSELLHKHGWASAGAIHLIDLDRLRRHFGDNWPRVEKRIETIVSRILERRLLPSDMWSQVEGPIYLVLFSSLGRDEAALKCALIAAEIERRVLGEGVAVPGSRVRAAEGRFDRIDQAVALDPKALVLALAAAAREGRPFAGAAGLPTSDATIYALAPAADRSAIPTGEPLWRPLPPGVEAGQAAWIPLDTAAAHTQGVAVPIPPPPARAHGEWQPLHQAEAAPGRPGEAPAPPASERTENDWRPRPGAELAAAAAGAGPPIAPLPARTPEDWQPIHRAGQAADPPGVAVPTAPPPACGGEDWRPGHPGDPAPSPAWREPPPPGRFDPAGVELYYRPMWDAKRHALSQYRCLPLRRRGAFLTSLTFVQGPAELAEMDMLVLAQAIAAIGRMLESGARALVEVPLHFPVLADALRRAPLLALLRSTPLSVRDLMACDVIGASKGTPGNRLHEVVSLLQPLIGRVTFRTRLVDPDIAAYAGLGIRAVSTDVAEAGLREETMLATFNRFVAVAERSGLRCHLHGVSSTSLSISAIGAGFDYIAGDAVAALQPTPGTMLRYQILDLYAPLLHPPGADSGGEPTSSAGR